MSYCEFPCILFDPGFVFPELFERECMIPCQSDSISSETIFPIFDESTLLDYQVQKSVCYHFNPNNNT